MAIQPITSKYIGHSGVECIFEYVDADSFDDLEYSKCKQTYAVCFCDEKIAIVYQGDKNTWGLVGGSIEKGETFEQTLKREIMEESNMEVINFLPIGYQKVTDTRDNDYIYQLRYVCTAKQNGVFVSDPAGAITEIKLIDIKNYKQYFDWGAIGDQIMERALELKPKLENN
jgi:8-oxo-dGTP pyrophosphatase MutT (NUDIX family)